MAVSALLPPIAAAPPLAGSTLSFGVPYQNKRRILTMRIYCAADEEEEVNDLGVNEKYHPYYPQAAVMCQLAVSTLCKHTKNTVLQRVVMDMIPQGGLVRKSYQSNDSLVKKLDLYAALKNITCIIANYPPRTTAVVKISANFQLSGIGEGFTRCLDIVIMVPVCGGKWLE
uniref:Uncharacterized protein n=1 Tax=Oryza nivara TaxID=4536 RepID=A0A0E0G4L6_ORYNI